MLVPIPRNPMTSLKPKHRLASHCDGAQHDTSTCPQQLIQQGIYYRYRSCRPETGSVFVMSACNQEARPAKARLITASREVLPGIHTSLPQMILRLSRCSPSDRALDDGFAAYDHVSVIVHYVEQDR